MLSLVYTRRYSLSCKRWGCKVLCATLNRAKPHWLKAIVTFSCCTVLHLDPTVTDSMHANKPTFGQMQSPDRLLLSPTCKRQSVCACLDVRPTVCSAVCAKFGLECIVYMGASCQQPESDNQSVACPGVSPITCSAGYSVCQVWSGMHCIHGS